MRLHRLHQRSKHIPALPRRLLKIRQPMPVVRFGGFRRPGLAAGIFGMGYAVARIFSEFFREPDPQLGFLFGSSVDALSGGITMGMLLSLPVFFAGLWLVLRSRRARPASLFMVSFRGRVAGRVGRDAGRAALEERRRAWHEPGSPSSPVRSECAIRCENPSP